MRYLAIIPTVLSAAALILTFLCFFAGHKQDFMQDYDLLTLNTSRIGQNLLDDNNSLISNLNIEGIPIGSIVSAIPPQLEGVVTDTIGAVTDRLGIEDFYAVHTLTYCFGQFTPTEVPNNTLSLGDIDRNTTGCGNTTAPYTFDPEAILQQALDQSGLGITLADLEWPEDIQRGIEALRTVSVAMFALYVIALITIFLTLVFSAITIFMNGRVVECLTFLMGTIAFLAIGVASGLVTVVLVVGTRVINEHGQQVGISASRGNKFLALTWAATAAMLLALLAILIDCCIPRRRAARRHAEKHPY